MDRLGRAAGRTWLPLVIAILVCCSLSPAHASLQEFRKPPLTIRKPYTFVDALPFPFQIGEAKSSVCLLPKVGSTRFKHLLTVASGVPLDTINKWTIAAKWNSHTGIRDKFHPWGSHAEVKQMLLDESVPRYVITRNPYTRFLSAYLNKLGSGQYDFVVRIERRPVRRSLMAKGSAPLSFPEFVHMVYRHWKRTGGYAGDYHFQPQSDHCLIPEGYSYDYVLKVELVDCWVKEFAAAVGAGQAALSGWGPGTDNLLWPHKCFHVPSNMTCDEFWADSYKPPCKCNAAERTADTVHVTNAATQLRRHYTPQAAREVGEMFAVDFKMFGYSLWDGASEDYFMC